MKRLLFVFAAAVVLIILTAPATADWDPIRDATGKITNHKMHFPQMPDLTTNGVDVLGTYPYPFATDPGGNQFGKILADDWKCSQTGPVTDIHIWGSWLNDQVPLAIDDSGNLIPDPASVGFKLSIHEDIPADPNNVPYSHPGKELWSELFDRFDPRVEVRPYAKVTEEMFWDPNPQPDGEQLGIDQTVWQYNFSLDPSTTPNVFTQREGTIYWLDVMAVPTSVNPGGTAPLWGWKTADRFQYPNNPDGLHFQDDAVFQDIPDPGVAPDPRAWSPLEYPGFHAFAGQSMDLAFVITPEPGTVAMLLGAGLMGLVFSFRRWRKR